MVHKRIVAYDAAVRTIHRLVIIVRSMAYSQTDVLEIAAMLDEIDYCFALIQSDTEFEEEWHSHLRRMAAKYPKQLGGIVEDYKEQLAYERRIIVPVDPARERTS